MNNYKYGIPPKELKEVRKYIIQDIKSNNKVDNPICNMTLQDYFDIIKEFMLALCNENGKVIDIYSWDKSYLSSKYDKDLRIMPSKDIAEEWMDGRGLFSVHGNSQMRVDENHFGNWPDIDWRDNNQWYHEDRLNDPLWFKECVHFIGHGGHPTETLKAGNLNPYEYEKDKWCVKFGTFSRGHWACLKGYLYMKNKGIPVFIDAAQQYLTSKQIEKLKSEGFLIKQNYDTEYYV